MIESINNEKIIKYSKLKQKKYRDESSLFIVEGKHLVEEAKKTNSIPSNEKNKLQLYSL